MAVTADITYKGANLTGLTFTVVEAQHLQSAYDNGTLQYACTVTMPSGDIQAGTGWENIRSESPDFTVSPLVDAEAKMVARLTAAGATNIETVGG